MYRLLIVDDDELIRKGLEKVIPWTELGYQIAGVFANGQKALDFLQTESADVILTDIKMPEMTGLELIELAKQLCPEVKSVIISGYSEFELAKKALSLKVEDYLLKPLGQDDVETVFIKLRQIMDMEHRKKSHLNPEKQQWEYELMQLLESRLHIEQLFLQTSQPIPYYEIIILKITKRTSAQHSDENLSECLKRIRDTFQGFFYCNVHAVFAALLPPENLNGILMQLKKEFFNLPDYSYQLLIGKEAYSAQEVIASYWSAVDLLKNNQTFGVLHYDRERSLYKKEWDKIQELKNNIISCIEAGKFYETNDIATQIYQILLHYDNKDIYHFYCNIIMKIIKYFELESSSLIYSQNRFSEINFLDSTPQQLFTDFLQDMDSIHTMLRENSDSMRNIIVNKAKGMIEANYADGSFSLASLANELGVSYGYLSTIFTKYTGKSFKTYLVNIRMERARLLLLTRKYKVYEIAQLVGYNNSRYFTDAFRKYYRCSPADYLSRFRGAYEKE